MSDQSFAEKQDENAQNNDVISPELFSISEFNKNSDTLHSEEFRFDIDGFEDLDEEEKKNYRLSYPNLESICERRIHCTSCNLHIGTAPIKESIIRMHSVLRVTQCKKCYTFYNSGEFEKGEDGCELHCRWCGGSQGGEVYCCTSCPYVFCRKCIVQNISKSCAISIQKNDLWKCFSCSPKVLTYLRAQHWALVNFIEKQKREISEKDLTDDEIKKLMNKDSSVCCKGAKRSPNVQKTSSRAQKRKSTTKIVELETSPKTKMLTIPLKPILPKIITKSQKSPEIKPPEKVKKVRNVKKKNKNNEELVCTPDILGMLEENTTQQEILIPDMPPLSPIKNVVQSPPFFSKIHNPSLAIRASNQSLISGNGLSNFQTMNRFQSTQQRFTWQNNKLIRINTPTSVNPTLIYPMIRGVRAQQSQRLSLLQGVLNSPTRNIMMNRPMTNTVMIPVNRQINGPTISPPISIRNSHPDTPLGNAQSQFEKNVEDSMEVCEHILGKIKTLVKSASYKDVKDFRDLKELNLHLSYLLTYAISRFRTLHKNCTDDGSKSGDTNSPAMDEKDDDIEIVEAQTTLIELDSDNENEKNKKNNNSKLDDDGKLQMNESQNVTTLDITVDSESDKICNESNINTQNNNETIELINDSEDENDGKSLNETTTNNQECNEIIEIDQTKDNEEEVNKKTDECLEKTESNKSNAEKETNKEDDVEITDLNENQIDKEIPVLNEAESIEPTVEDIELTNINPIKDKPLEMNTKDDIMEVEDSKNPEAELTKEDSKITEDELTENGDKNTEIFEEKRDDIEKTDHPEDVEVVPDELIQEITVESEEIIEEENSSINITKINENSNSNNDSELNSEEILKEFLENYRKDIPDDKFDENLIKKEISNLIKLRTSSKEQIIENIFKIFTEGNG